MREHPTIRTEAVTPATRRVPTAMEPFKPEPWTRDALCAEADPEAFFPEKGGSTKAAKAICASCDVMQECLDYAIANEQQIGIWGGRSSRELRKLIKARKAA